MNDSHIMDPNNALEHKSQAAQAAEDLRSAAASQASQFGQAVEKHASAAVDSTADRAEQIRQAAETGWEEAKVKMQDLLQEGEAYVRENPGKSVASALGVGFVLGLLFRR